MVLAVTAMVLPLTVMVLQMGVGDLVANLPL
jgi:hypothetical protein